MNNSVKIRKDLLARHAAFEALKAVYGGDAPDGAVAAMDARLETPLDRSFARMLFYTVLRRSGETDSVIRRFVKKPMKKTDAVLLLRMGLTQLLFMDSAEHGVIFSTVELAKLMKFYPHISLINAVLRSCQREKEDIHTSPISNLPSWLKNPLEKTYGRDRLIKIAASIIHPPALYLTVKNRPEEWAEKFGGKAIGNNTVFVPPAKIEELPGYEAGEWWVQDFSAALPATLFSGPLQGKTAADFCAAPGGKTAQLVNMGAKVTAFDISPKRIDILKANLKRLKFEAEIISADAAQWLRQNPKKFDYILLDAPCSATGTMRRNPDILSKKSILPPLEEQRKLLEAAVCSLKEGGEIVYSVCSLLAEEGKRQIESFLERHPEMKSIPLNGLPPEISVDGGLLVTPEYMDENGGVDGFFAAKLAFR